MPVDSDIGLSNAGFYINGEHWKSLLMKLRPICCILTLWVVSL
jgi:hypothetical protein